MKVKDLLLKRELVAYLLEEKGVKFSSKGKIPRREKTDDLPLSYAQQRLFFLEQLEGSSPTYNISMPVRIQGRLSIVALEQAINEIVSRHEVLRASFGSLMGHPIQIISPELYLHLPLTDLSTLPAEDKDAELLRLIRQEAALPFDLSAGPLLRTSLLRLGEDEFALLLTMHHIVSDGWSSAILLRELGQLYRAFVEGRPSPLPDLPIQYVDFAVWQKQWLVGEVLDAQLDYWKQHLAGAPALLELPTDRPRPAVRSFSGANESLFLSASLSHALRALSQREDATLFMTLLAAFKALLWRYTGQADIVVGTPIAGRNRAEVEPLIGFFINTLALRTRVEGAESFRQLLKQVREVCLGAYAHQDLPFEKLVEELQPARSLSHTPLFQVMFTLQQGTGASIELTDLSLSPLEIDNETEKFDLTLFVDETEAQMHVVFGYNTEIFERESIKRLLQHFNHLLAAIVANPRQRLSRLSLLPEPERRLILQQWNETACDWLASPAPASPAAVLALLAETPAPGGLPAWSDLLTLPHLFEQQVQLSPDATALSFEGRHLSYRQLNERANQLAHHLLSLGLVPDAQVGVMMERSLEMVISLLAILKAGAAYVPFDPSYPEARLSFMLEDAGVALLLTQAHLLERLSVSTAGVAGTESVSSALQVLAIDALSETLAEHPTSNPKVALSGSHLAYMIYTSGSTGQPKGALNTHQAIVNRLLWMQHRYQLSASDVVLQKTPFSFDVSVWEFFWPLLNGARLVVARPDGHRDTAYLREVIEREQVSTLHFVPAMLQAFLSDPEVATGCRSLRRVICSGEALGVDLAARCLQQLPQAELHNLYGPTEAAVDVTSWQCKSNDRSASVPIGKPISNLSLYILDSELQPVPVGVSGELYIGGVGLARGYHRRAGLTAEKFIPHPYSHRGGERLYRTGDVARHRVDGEIEYLGRVDHQVKLRGFRIELGEIEAVLREHEEVQEAVVLARPDGRGERRLVGYLMVEGGGAEIEVEEVRQYLQSRLPEYMVPQVLMKVAEWPLTPSGKVDRAKLPEPVGGRGQTRTEMVLPRNEAEQVLAGVWQEVLGLTEVGVHDNYFALGGDSIRSLQVVALARHRGLRLSLQQLFQHQTIAELVAVAQSDKGEAHPGTESHTHSEPFSLISHEDYEKLPEDVEDAYPLTMLQAGMLYHMALTPETPLYHNVNSMKLRSALDLDALKESARMVVARHAALRTGFELSRYSEPLQLVYKLAEMEIGVEDISGQSEEDQARAIDNHLEAEKRRGFNVSQPPLMRFHIHRYGANIFQFTLTECHPIQDGWSLHTVLAEMFSHYYALVKGEELPVLEPVSVSYRDFVRMEREALESEEQRQYWRQKLQDNTVLELPRWKSAQAKSRQSQNENDIPDVRFHEVRIPLKLSGELKDFARTLGVPIKSVVLAAHMKVLSILSGQTDILTGVVSNGRSEEVGGELTVGLFLNTLPFRQQLIGGTWNELVRATFDNEWELLPYRRYPMAALQHSRGGQQLYETAFNFLHFHVVDSVIQSGNVDVLEIKASEGTNWTLQAHFSLGLDALQLELQLEYNSLELCTEQMEAFEGYYLSVLRAMVRDPLAHHEYQSFLSTAEEQQQEEKGSGDERAYPLDSSFSHLFSQQVLRSPHALALVSDSARFSYLELDKQAALLSHRLGALGVGPDSLVALLDHRSPELLVAILALCKLGAAYLPLDPRHPPLRLQQIIGQSRTPLVLSSAACRSLLTSALEALPLDERPRVHDMTAVEAVKEIAEETFEERVEPDAAVSGIAPASHQGRPDNLAYVIYTSGSTGQPKGAMVTVRGLLNHLWAKIETLHLTASDVVAQTASQCFDISVWQMLAPLLVGAQVRLVTDEVGMDPARLLRLMEAEQVTIVEMVPSLLSALVDEMGVPHSDNESHSESETERGGGTRLGGLRWMIATGEALPPELCRRWLAVCGRQTRLLNAYGPTECADDVTHYEVVSAPEAEVTRMAIGRAIGNTRLYLLNQEMQMVPVGVSAEIYVGGAGVGRGYVGDGSATAKSFVPDPFSAAGGGRLYRTGDVGRLRADGELEYVGRMDYQVKVRGYRIELGEVEAALREQAGVREAVVVVREEAGGERRLVGYVVEAEQGTGAGVTGNGTGRLDLKELRAGLELRLPEYMRPQAVVIVEQMPLTPNGKLDRNALPPPEGWSIDQGVEFVAPRTELEQQIAGIWREVLDVEKVGLHDNFFDLGGHSIRMIEASGKLKLALNREMSVVDMFRHPTVSAMAEFLSAQPSGEIEFAENVERAGARRANMKRQREGRKKKRA